MVNGNSLDVLAIAAHPDDVELNAGGTVCLLSRQGYRVGIADLTNGELGSRGSPEGRKREALAAGRVLGLTVRMNLGIADGNIADTPENRLEVIRVLRSYRPHIVLAHPLECRHPDHTRAARLTLDACYYSGLRKIETTETDGAPQDPWRPHHILHYSEVLPFEPSFVVDVTETWDTRMRAMREFRSQFFNPGYKPEEDEPDTFVSNPDFFAWIEARARAYGYPIGATYGEPFQYHGSLRVPDLMALLGGDKPYR